MIFSILSSTIHCIFQSLFLTQKIPVILCPGFCPDAGGLRWFFSSTIVYLISSVFRFIGGVALLFYLKWQLAIVVVLVLPGLVLVVRYFAKRVKDSQPSRDGTACEGTPVGPGISINNIIDQSILVRKKEL